jgi:hypothetical protein
MFRRTLCAAALLCVVALAGGGVTAIAAPAHSHAVKKHKVAAKPKTGARGKPGAAGATGKHGKNGSAGATGPGGTNGANGTNGTSGGNGTNGPGGAAGTSFLRTVIVSPNATTQMGNGALLLAALANLGTVNSGNPALIWVEPGVYDIGTSALSLSAFTDLTGAGQDTTFITGEGPSAISAAANTEIRDVTVKDTNASGAAAAITTGGGLRNVTAKATGTSAAIGVVANAPTLALINVNAMGTTSGAGSLVVALQTSSAVTVSGGTFTANDSATSGQASALQVLSGGGAVNGATLTATGGAAATAYPVALVAGSETVKILSSTLIGTGGLFVFGGDTLDIGGSQVPGVITGVAGTANCPADWLANYLATGSACT